VAGRIESQAGKCGAHRLDVDGIVDAKPGKCEAHRDQVIGIGLAAATRRAMLAAPSTIKSPFSCRASRRKPLLSLSGPSVASSGESGNLAGGHNCAKRLMTLKGSLLRVNSQMLAETPDRFRRNLLHHAAGLNM